MNYEAILKNQDINVCAIFYYGRSGTYFIQSLIDGHSEVMTFPFGTNMQMYQEKFDSKVNWENTYQNESYEGVFDLFMSLERISFAFDGNLGSEMRLNQLGEEKDKILKVCKKEFKSHFVGFLQSFGKVTRKTVFLSSYYAYFLTQGHQLDNKKIIFFQAHTINTYSLSKLKNDFPNFKTLISIRDPRSTFTSHVNHFVNKNNNGYISLKQYIDLYTPMLGLFDQAHEAHLDINNIKTIKLEDVHNSPRETLQNLAQWMGISYEKTLLHSSCHGLTWWGDATIPPVTGFAKHIINTKWKSYLSMLDLLKMEISLEKYIVKYNYKFHSSVATRKAVSCFYLIAILIPTNYELKILQKAFFSQSSKSLFHRIRKALSEYKYYYKKRLFLDKWSIKNSENRLMIDTV